MKKENQQLKFNKWIKFFKFKSKIFKKEKSWKKI